MNTPVRKLSIFALFWLVSTLSLLASNPAQLDISTYLSKAENGVIYPTAEQIEMLSPFVPTDTYQPAPSIHDRAFWSQIAEKQSAQQIVAEASANLGKLPEVPISDEIYRRANKEGNRGIYKPRYYRTMEVLEKAVIAECIENMGRYIPQISEHLYAIMAMKSWLHPNHDDGKNSVLEGKRVAIDLGARKFGSVLMLAAVLLEDRLTDQMQLKIRSEIEWRITDSYLKSCRGLDRKGNSWIYGTSNWNSVCTGGTLFSTLTAAEDRDTRIAVLGSAINSMRYYLSGFGEDGYCSEGIGYWNYGFGNYLYLSQMIYDYTGGAIDMFRFDDPIKMKRVGNFPSQFEIQQSIYPCFSDGASRVKEGSDNYAYILSAKNYGARKPSYSRPADITMQLQEWADPVSYIDTDPSALELPSHTYFEDYGIIISRGKQTVPFSIAIKAGHNEENHNHMDVGSYVMVMADDHEMCGDIGAPPYKAGAFSKKHPARSSWGHPVPSVDGKLQSYGRRFHGKVIETEFSESRDRAVIDIKEAYEVPSLEHLIRTVENSREGEGQITVTDTFRASEAIEFGTAIMTHGDYEIVDNHTVLLSRDGQSIHVSITSEGGEVEIVDEKVPVKDIRYADEAFRIGINFQERLRGGSIAMVFSPVLSN